jgi:hypothetical protein
MVLARYGWPMPMGVVGSVSRPSVTMALRAGSQLPMIARIEYKFDLDIDPHGFELIAQDGEEKAAYEVLKEF